MAENDFLNQSPENFLNREDFLSYNPEDFLDSEQQAIEATKEENKHLKTEVAIAVGIGVGFLVWLALSRRKLKKAKPQNKDEAYAALKMVWSKTAPAWMQMVTPAIAAAYQVGSQQLAMSDLKLAEIAQEYTYNLGHYLSATSDNAVIEGFAAQLNKNVNPSIAWERAVEAYGLDKQQMRSYIIQSGEQNIPYQTEAVPKGLKGIIQKLLHQRADKVAKHEAWASMTMGKNVVWLYQQEMGILPRDAMKEWITAEDERVCPVCAPLDRQRVPINEKFETQSGSFWTPAIHVNCRCDIRIVLPEQIQKAFGKDLYDRDEKGRFAAEEERKHAPSAQTERLIEDVKEWLHKPTEEEYKSPLDNIQINKSPLDNKSWVMRGSSPLDTAVSPLDQEPEYVSPLDNISPLDRLSVLGQSSAGGSGTTQKKNGDGSRTPPLDPFGGDNEGVLILSPEYFMKRFGIDYYSPHFIGSGAGEPFQIMLDSADFKDLDIPKDAKDPMYGIERINNALEAENYTNNSTENAILASLNSNYDDVKQGYLDLENFNDSGNDDVLYDRLIASNRVRIADGDSISNIEYIRNYMPTILILEDTPKLGNVMRASVRHDTTFPDRMASVTIGRDGVREFYSKQFGGSEIVWDDENRATRATPSHIRERYPELFVDNPWSQYGAYTIWDIKKE